MRKYLFLLTLFAACTRTQIPETQVGKVTQSPEEIVRTFVSLSGSATSVEDRRKLQELCMGEMKRAFEVMSNDEFRVAYVNGHIKIEELKILEASTKNDLAHVSYVVTVDNSIGADRTKEINQREVELKLSQGGWYIESIRLKGADNLAFTRGMIF